MKAPLRVFFSAVLTLALLARGAAACPLKAKPRACCQKPGPAAPATPCAQMSCCQALAATAAPAVVRAGEYGWPAPAARPPVRRDGPASLVSAPRSAGPPGAQRLAASCRAPPASRRA